jgi:hypothetical protein
LATQHDLALVLWRQGRLAEAEAEIRQVLAISHATLGASHPHTLAAEQGLDRVPGSGLLARDANVYIRPIFTA